MPDYIDKVIFLDVDTILLKDISLLYNVPLGTNIIAAVQDSRIITFSNEWGGILNYRELNIEPDTKYFNAGVLVISTSKWKEQDITRRILECINNNIKFVNYADQYGLNIVLADNWLQLDNGWNYFASGDLKDPYLIHFVSRKPFYTSYSSNLNYKKLFYSYLSQTKWQNAKPVGETQRYFKKMSNVLLKIIKRYL